MDKREQEPQWYEQARKGPFPEMKFTEEAAGKVARQIGMDGSSLNQVLPSGRRRRAIRLRILSAAIILLLFGAGAVYWGSGWSGQPGGFNPLQVSSAGIIDPPVAGQADLTDEGLRATAEQVMLEQLGKKLPFVSLEPLVEEGETLEEFKDGDSFAKIWFETETGKVVRTYMDTFFSPEQIDSKFIDEAMDQLRKAGYKGEFTVTALHHSVHYGTNADEQGIQTDDSLIAEEGQIDYENGVYRSSTFKMGENEVSAEVKQEGLKAIKLLREKGTDHLYSIKRTVAQKWDVLVLTYGESERGATTVMMDYATQDIIQVEDMALYDENSFTSADPNTNLLNMDKAKLQLAAAAIADEMFGIRLEDYTFVKEMSGIGSIAFKSPDGATIITGSYNLDGTFYMIQQTPATAE
ncbi:hypothetical protein GC101_17745 [Paenibacillus sp. LMG 31459]|uniref:PepSY domain-containing protein n=1 Tax=Paenibacillus phytohabitans TaxID=2654978 RepID=A0ABX1YI63_9BACL|nr:hypothetical protein [Paenibacillus phytohabitans]NOU80710.1 hypothetical protein [Paenibacillus phytohabitans]